MLISCEMASGYDVTITLYQNHVIVRVTHVVDTVDAINVFIYFVVVTLLFQLLAKHSSAALPCQ